MKKYLGIDLGGINVAAAVVGEDGTILGRGRRATPRTGARHVAEAMAQACVQAADQAGCRPAEIESVGVGSPGTIEPETGEVVYWSNLDFLHVPLARMLEEQIALPIYLENDANAAALGEYVAGAGRGSRSMVAITLGTGIGGGAVLDGKLYTGFNYAALEVGHLTVEHGGRPCTCGRRGCFEAYASATALMERAWERMQERRESLLWELTGGERAALSAKTVFDAADREDGLARELILEYQDYLACGIVSLINVFQPEVFCVGGGVAGAGEKLMGRVREVVAREDYARNNARQTTLTLAKLGNDAGLVGAALLPLFR